MKRRIKNLALAFGTVMALMIFVASCQTFEDLVPTEYGAWENHYIYRGNVRSKTTGEDAETLVSSITHAGKNYHTMDCFDYEFLDDDIYLCLSFSEELYNTDDLHNGIVRYNVKEKMQETVCFDLTAVSPEDENVLFSYEPYAIEKVFEDKILLYGRRYAIETEENNGESEAYTDLWYNVDLDGNFLGEEATSYVDWARVGEDYWLHYNYEECSYEYLTWGMENPVRICKGSYKDVQFVEKNGVKGFLISSENSLEFFDLATSTRTELWEGIGFEWISAPEYEYFMSSEPITVTYTEWKYGGLFLIFIKETKTRSIQGDCQLFKLDYSTDGVRVEKVHTFEREKDFTAAAGIADGKLYVRGIWYLSQRGCKDGGSESRYYAFDLTTKQFDEIEESDDYKYYEDMCYTKAALENGGVVFGDYMYYIHRETVNPGLMVQNYTAYLLKRYRLSDGKIDIMQIWSEEDAYGNDEMENFCEEMWLKNGDNIDDFIIRNY